MRPRYIGYDKYVLVSSVEFKIAWISPLLVSIKLPTECIFQQDRISALGWFESHLMVQNRFLLVISSSYSQVLLEGYIQAMFFLHECRYSNFYLAKASEIQRSSAGTKKPGSWLKESSNTQRSDTGSSDSSVYRKRTSTKAGWSSRFSADSPGWVKSCPGTEWRRSSSLWGKRRSGMS